MMKNSGLTVPGTLWPPPVTHPLLACSTLSPTFLLERNPASVPPPGRVPKEWNNDRKFLLKRWSSLLPPFLLSVPRVVVTPAPVLVRHPAVNACRMPIKCLIKGRHLLNTRLLFPGTGLETTSGAWVLLTSMELILLMTVQPRPSRMRLLGENVTPLSKQLKLNLPPALKATLVPHVSW